MTTDEKLNHLVKRLDDVQAMLEAVADGHGHDVERQLRRKATLRQGRELMGWSTGDGAKVQMYEGAKVGRAA